MPSHDLPFFKPKGDQKHQNAVKLKPTEDLSVENGSIEITDYQGTSEDVAEWERIQSTRNIKPPKG